MSIKREIYDDGWESGECSEDEIVHYSISKKKHKKRKKKAKRSSHSPDKIKNEKRFFNPYLINPTKFIRALSHDEANDEQISIHVPDMTSVAIISSTFDNLNNVDPTSELVFSNSTNKLTYIPATENEFDYEVVRRPYPTVYDHDYLYESDKWGIDTCPNVYQYMMSLGLREDIVSDLVTVFNKTESIEEKPLSEHETTEFDEELYEQDLINEIPIVEPMEHIADPVDGPRYSPEPANKVREPCYAPQSDVYHDLFDPHCLPPVTDKDPRLKFVKNLPHRLVSQMNSVQREDERVSVNNHNRRLEMTETNITNVVKECLRLYLSNSDISKEEYKAILRKAVPKIMDSGEKKVDPTKIGKFIYSYVVLAQKSRV